MGLDVWFQEDVKRIYAALARTAARTSGDYARGYFDALNDWAAAFGIQAETRPPIRVLDRGEMTIFDRDGNQVAG